MRERVHRWLDSVFGRKTFTSLFVVTPLTLALEYTITGPQYVAVIFVGMSVAAAIVGSYWEEFEDEIDEAADAVDEATDKAAEAVEEATDGE